MLKVSKRFFFPLIWKFREMLPSVPKVRPSLQTPQRYRRVPSARICVWISTAPPLHRSTASSLVPHSCLTPNLHCPAALSERRGIINPRRGWQPCVAPYFADLGVGDMRGPPMVAPMMPPRRRWQAVITPHDPTSHPRDTQHVARNTMVEATASHHLRGAIWGDTTTPSPHVATTPRGEIRGYARLQPLAG